MEEKNLRVDRAVRMVTVENRTGSVFFLKIYPDKVSLFPRKHLSVQKFYSPGLPGKGCQGHWTATKDLTCPTQGHTDMYTHMQSYTRGHRHTCSVHT